MNTDYDIMEVQYSSYKLFQHIVLELALYVFFIVILYFLQVKWFFNNDPIVSPDYKISNVGDTYSCYIPEVFEEDAGRFSITAENDIGKATCSALLVVVDEANSLPKPPSPPEGIRQPFFQPQVCLMAILESSVCSVYI